MKRSRKLIILALVMLLAFTGCGSKKFSYSNGIDKNGLWKDVTAMDCVELGAYTDIVIPADIHTPTEQAVQDAIDNLVANYPIRVEIRDRAVADADTVNIDYVGSVDGVPFENGSTNGAGTDVTVGVTNYIDDFIQQLVGHMPGDSFDIEVTFPEEYGTAELAGKDAVFATTINYIVENEDPVITDAWVAETLNETYGWLTVLDMKSALSNNIMDSNITSFLQESIVGTSTVNTLPDSMLQYQEDSLVYYYQQYADSYKVSLDEFLTSYVGVESKEALVETYKQECIDTANMYLVMQAVAEAADISVSDEDVETYFANYNGSTDYKEYKDYFGMPYIKCLVLNQKVVDYMADNAIYE